MFASEGIKKFTPPIRVWKTIHPPPLIGTYKIQPPSNFSDPLPVLRPSNRVQLIASNFLSSDTTFLSTCSIANQIV